MIATPIDDLQVEDLQGKVTQKVVLENIRWQTYQAPLTVSGWSLVTRRKENR